MRDSVIFEAPSTVAGFRLREQLEARFGTATTPQFTLTITLDISRDSVAISDDGDITRVTLPGRAHYVLTDSAGNVRAQGSVNSFTSYSTTGTTVATQAAEEDAVDRLAIILADLITTRLLAATVT